jgi:hypothetical protein
MGAGVILRELVRLCRQNWDAEYPMPASMQFEDGNWVINFLNDAEDKHPASYVRGNHSKLVLLGKRAPSGTFELPGELTADELGSHLARRFELTQFADKGKPAVVVEPAATSWQKIKSQSGLSFKRLYERSVNRSFPYISTASIPELQLVYRERLRNSCSQASVLDSDLLVTSAEGIGKTRAFFDLMAESALDTALAHYDNKVRFFAFASRHRAQAEEKATEYRSNGRRACVLKPFWVHYEEVCERLGKDTIPKNRFEDETNIISVLDQVAHEQCHVFEELERVRRDLWGGKANPLFTTTTALFFSHATVMTWAQTHMTRVWHHPNFEPTCDPKDVATLRNELVLQKVVVDEPESDELVHLLSHENFAHLSNVECRAWKNLSMRHRREEFKSMQADEALVRLMDFEKYNELRMLDVSHFEEIEVDYYAQPFGRENSSSAIYISRHGGRYYVAPRDWLFGSYNEPGWTFLTSEKFTSDLLSALYEKRSRFILRLDLDRLPGLYPIDVPVVKDPRASSRHIDSLVSEILASNENAVVIADGISSELREERGGRVSTFQGMKGYNGWADRDVFIVLTYLHPEVYAQLNVIGRWTDSIDTVVGYYAAQLSQAAGRNTGFRKNSQTKTVVIMTSGLLRLIGSDLERLAPRLRLRPSPERLW